MMFNMLSAADWLFKNIDFVFIAVLVLFTAYGAWRGFFAQLAGFIVTLIAIVGATFLSRPLLLFLSNNTSLVTMIASTLNGWVDSAFPSLKNVDATSIAENLQAVALPEAVKTTVQSYALNEKGETINLSGLIARAVAGYIMMAVCFLVIFLAIRLIFVIIRGVGRGLRKSIVVKIIDTILGGALAALKISFFAFFIIFLINLVPFSFLDGFKETLKNSKVLKFIMEKNFVDFLLRLLQL